MPKAISFLWISPIAKNMMRKKKKKEKKEKASSMLYFSISNKNG